jgi:hypothetical protein
MLNPFIFDPKGKLEKDCRPIDEERNAQYHGSLVRQPTRRNRMALRLGKLLIRMGKELAGEGAFQADPEQAGWPQGNSTNPRSARFHHA